MNGRRSQRGGALLTTLIMTAVILAMLGALMLYANRVRMRAVDVSRAYTRLSCSEAGLQLARSYFGRTFAQWNTYLANPDAYDPIRSSYNVIPADPNSPGLRAAHPELFADIDGDSPGGDREPDVFIYVRDNQDERPPAPPNWARDNDQNVIVGALCISRTMTPRSDRVDGMDGGVVVRDPQSAESLLSFNSAQHGCTQAYCGDGTGNMN
jgi:hypothetical protein